MLEEKLQKSIGVALILLQMSFKKSSNNISIPVVRLIASKYPLIL